jgi:predicted DNA-binding transcriptional regulator YafY
MNPIERALGILLVLTGGKRVSAAELARRFEVSLRTIYRDVERLLALGVPVEADRGAEGGYRLPPGYIQPPVALTRSETAALLVALALVRGLRATPLLADLDTAEKKLLAALPRAARDLLINGSRLVGIEALPPDIFHSQRPPAGGGNSQRAVDGFLEGLLGGRRVRFLHESASRGTEREHEVEPAGLLYDRDYWYLVGRSLEHGEVRLWRADRVSTITVTGFAYRPDPEFSVASLLGREWLNKAMRRWEAEGEGARIRITAQQAEVLGRDWFYRHAAIAPDGDGRLVMTLPDADRGTVFPLLRWLGPGAELLAPAALRNELGEQLAALAAVHAGEPRRESGPEPAAAAPGPGEPAKSAPSVPTASRARGG